MSSSSVSSLASMMNNRLRLSGLSSGLDIDSMVQQLMQVEKAKVDKVVQQKTLLEWKSDDYRAITNSIRSFNDTYFNYLKPTTNFKSVSSFATYSITSSNESVAVAKGNAGAVSTTHTLNVTQLATYSTVTGRTGIAAPILGSNIITDFNLQGKQINVTLDGVTKTIDLEDYTGMSDLISKLNTKLTTAFNGKVKVEDVSGQLKFSTTIDGSTLSIAEAPNNYINTLGFASGTKNYITGKEISPDNLTFTNGTFMIKVGSDAEQTITIDNASDINQLSDKINSAIQANPALAGKVAASVNGTSLEFKSPTGESVKLISGTSNNILSKIGFTSGATFGTTGTSAASLVGIEKGKSFIINIDGTDKTIVMSNDFTTLQDLANDISIQAGVTVNVSGDKLVFATNSKIELKKGPEDSLSKLGFISTDPVSNKLNLNAKLNTLGTILPGLNVTDDTQIVTFTINGVSVTTNKSYANSTLNDVMSAINSSSAGVQISFNSLKNQFNITSKTTGADTKITLGDNSENLLDSMGLITGATKTDGVDAIFDLDGVNGMVRTSNDFTIDGVSYTLKSVGGPITINVGVDIDAAVKNIKDFINGYNSLLDTINKKISEQRPKSNGSYYDPLTDDQKSAMKDADVAAWEEKAKQGMLYDDSILTGIVNNLRSAIYNPTSASSWTMSSIGISSTSYTDKGKLTVDEDKLKKALQADFVGVTNLFTKDYSLSYTDTMDSAANKKERYQNVGIAQRISDIVQDAVRTTRNASGYKGTLLEVAGIQGDVTEYDNQLLDQINNKQTLIDKLNNELGDKENYYYTKFTAMETALSQMNSQSAWLSQQFGG